MTPIIHSARIPLYSRPNKSDPTGMSCKEPFASHVDQTERGRDVVVTEKCIADIRALLRRDGQSNDWEMGASGLE
ncbi:hypothetical protein GYMLUDRAFT_250016 [Collybiopsis luxurians FD-317 M1]|uniref:Uncharacterized protein n=1 Tax=Collybiopsis luxurians FD-317 M1 TaxID=944289 RepID=A0A0D0BGJ2_9AGAR|nr:hypothetical protein GYMLUDRAFT_250016 [Collybiopsis luxurians FD-317 M1]